MAEPTPFRHYLISKSLQGNPVELLRTKDEVVCLAYDTKLRRIIDLHALIEPVADRATFQKRTKLLHQIQHPALAWFLEAGEDDGAWYYVTAHADGERLGDYLARSEQLPASIAASICTTIVEAILTLNSHPELLPALHVDNFTVEPGFAESRTILTQFQLQGSAPQPPGRRPSKAQVEKRARGLLDLVAQRIGSRWTRMEARISGTTFREALEQLLASPHDLLFDPLKEIHPWLYEASSGTEDLDNWLERHRPRPFLASRLEGRDTLKSVFHDQFQTDHAYPDTAHAYTFTGSTPDHSQRLCIQRLPSRPYTGEEPRQEVRRVLLRHTPVEHPHLLRVAAFEDSATTAFFLEELPSGLELTQWKRQQGPVSPDDGVPILEGTAQALKESELLGMKPFGLDPEDIFVTPAKEQDQGNRSRSASTPAWQVKWRAHPCVRKLIRRPVADSVEFPPLDFTWLACWLFDYQPGATSSEDTHLDKPVLQALEAAWQKALQGEPLAPQDLATQLRQVAQLATAAGPRLREPMGTTRASSAPAPAKPTAEPSVSPEAQEPTFEKITQIPFQDPIPQPIPQPKPQPLAEPIAITHRPEPIQPVAPAHPPYTPEKEYEPEEEDDDFEEEPPSIFRPERGLTRLQPAPGMISANPIYAPPPQEEEDDEEYDPPAFAALMRPSSESKAHVTKKSSNTPGLAEVLFDSNKRKSSTREPAYEPPASPFPLETTTAPAITTSWMDPNDSGAFSDYRPRKEGIPFLIKFLLVLVLSAVAGAFFHNAREGFPTGPQPNTPDSNTTPPTTPSGLEGILDPSNPPSATPVTPVAPVDSGVPLLPAPEFTTPAPSLPSTVLPPPRIDLPSEPPSQNLPTPSLPEPGIPPATPFEPLPPTPVPGDNTPAPVPTPVTPPAPTIPETPVPAPGESPIPRAIPVPERPAIPTGPAAPGGPIPPSEAPPATTIPSATPIPESPAQPTIPKAIPIPEN